MFILRTICEVFFLPHMRTFDIYECGHQIAADKNKMITCYIYSNYILYILYS